MFNANILTYNKFCKQKHGYISDSCEFKTIFCLINLLYQKINLVYCKHVKVITEIFLSFRVKKTIDLNRY